MHNYRDDVLEEMARTFFVLTWSDVMEEAGKSFPGQELFEVAPTTTPGAMKYAESVLSEIEERNNVSMDEFVPAGMEEDDFGIKQAEDLGYCLAMESLGHGVGWTDNYPEDHGLKLPQADGYGWNIDVREDDPAIKKDLEEWMDDRVREQGLEERSSSGRTQKTGVSEVEDGIKDYAESIKQRMPPEIKKLWHLLYTDLMYGPVYLNKKDEQVSMWDEDYDHAFDFSEAAETFGRWLEENVNDIWITDSGSVYTSEHELLDDAGNFARELLEEEGLPADEVESKLERGEGYPEYGQADARDIIREIVGGELIQYL